MLDHRENVVAGCRLGWQRRPLNVKARGEQESASGPGQPRQVGSCPRGGHSQHPVRGRTCHRWDDHAL